MYCQFAFLRRCIKRKDIERTLDGLPKTLEGTYTRILEEIDEQNWKYAHIIFQCVAAAFRPLHVDELSQFLAFDFEAESTPTFQADELSGDPADTVLTMCSSLLAVVKPEGHDFPVVQFAHFTVKEYLTSKALEAEDTISHFHISKASSHTTVAQGCLGLLLHFDETVTRDSLKEFPLAQYAAEYWMDHAQIEGVSSEVEDGMKRLFDPSKRHLSVWVRIKRLCDQKYGFWPRYGQETPLHAAFCGLHDAAKFLIVGHLQDANARGFSDEETPLHLASCLGHANIARRLLGHGANRDARDDNKSTPLHLSSKEGHLEVVRILLEQGADANAQDCLGLNPLQCASSRGHLQVARILLEHGADVKHKDLSDSTILHVAKGEEVTRLLLKHGADANALGFQGQTPLHSLSYLGRLEAARTILEHGVDANSRDASNATPLHLASDTPFLEHGDRTDVVRLLLQYGSDIHARDNEGRTPFMRATAAGKEDIMRLLLEYGAEDHRK